MTDFDDQLSAAVNNDGIDRSGPVPPLGPASREWTRRRNRRFGVLGTTAAVAVAVAGLGAASLISGDDRSDLVVTNSVPAPPTTPQATDSVVSESDPSPDTTVTEPSDEPAPSVEPTPATSLPTTTSPLPTTSPATAPTGTTTPGPRGPVQVNDALVAGNSTIDLDNRIEVRDPGGTVLWSYQYCDAGVACSASLQTVTLDDAWLIVDQGDRFVGPPTSSVLQRVSLADGSMVAEVVAAPGSWYVAGQPTAAGLVLATSTTSEQGHRVDVNAIDDGVDTSIAEDVDSVEISADGRYLAMTVSNPPETYGETELLVRDLETGRSAEQTMPMIAASPGEWSPDGTHLIVDNAWENTVTYLIDPWADGDAAGDSTLRNSDDVHWEYACFVDDSTIAVATWDSPYAEVSAVSGTILLVDVATLAVVGDLGIDAYGHGLVCHPDATATFVSIPLTTRILGEGGPDPFEVTEPDPGAPSEVVHAVGEGRSVTTGGDGVLLDSVR